MQRMQLDQHESMQTFPSFFSEAGGGWVLYTHNCCTVTPCILEDMASCLLAWNGLVSRISTSAASE